MTMIGGPMNVLWTFNLGCMSSKATPNWSDLLSLETQYQLEFRKQWLNDNNSQNAILY